MAGMSRQMTLAWASMGHMDQSAQDVHMRLVRIEEKLDHVLEQVRKINGRVNGLENWRHEEQIRQARAEGRSEAVITRKHIAFLIAAVPAISAIIGVVSRYFL